MRTLKKTLAVVLVVAMMMSLCITSNADFADADKINYVEAVEVLTAIGVIDGFPEDETFRPQGELTRAQAAKILVYILGAENYAKADGQIFDDVPTYHWAADYIAYCAENGLVDGYGNGKFGPEDKLTGYQWAKMLLAAMGVDTTEMIGAAWQIPVAQAAASYGIFAGNAAADKTEIATREEACLYALNVLNYSDSMKVGYAVYDDRGTVSDKDDKLVEIYPSVTEAVRAAATLNKAEGVDDYYAVATSVKVISNMLYDIHGVALSRSHDKWGRPGNLYSSRAFNAFYADAYLAQYTTAVAECDIADELGLKKDGTITALTVNGESVTVYNTTTEKYMYAIELLGTRSYQGAQGRLLEVYSDGLGGYEIVEIDQYLAKVVRVSDVEYDRNGHIDTYAQLVLDIYDQDVSDEDSNLVDQVVLESKTNYDYARGDMLLVYYDVEDDSTVADDEVVEIIAYADSITGAQTKLTTKESHVVDGVEYMDAVQLNLDEAGTQTGTHTWYFDTYGNLIGVVDVATVYTFGTITDIYWKDSNNGDNGYAVATITYMDGTSETATVYSIEGTVLEGIEGNWASYYWGEVSSTKQYNADEFANVALYKITEGRYGLMLEETTFVEDATLKTGVTTLKTNELYADKNTVFLIWDSISETYESVVGIKNLSTYYGEYDVWAAELAKDTLAEYVFVNDPAIVTTTNALYFNTGVYADVETDLYANLPYMYTIGSGYLNNVADQDIYVAADYGYEASYTDSAVIDALKATEGQLVWLTLTNGYVTDVQTVYDAQMVDAINRYYAVYLGDDAVVNNALTLLTDGDGTSYDIADIKAPINTKSWTTAMAANVNLWVVYTVNGGAKTAQYVYASTADATAPEAPAADDNLYSVTVKGVEAVQGTGKGTAADPIEYTVNLTAAQMASSEKNLVAVADYAGNDVTVVLSAGNKVNEDARISAVGADWTWTLICDGVYYEVVINEVKTAQEQIDAAIAAGEDTVVLAAGVYTEDVYINGDIVVDGADKATIIGKVWIGTDWNSAVSNVTLKNITFGIPDDFTTGKYVAVQTGIVNGGRVTITDCHFVDANAAEAACCALYLNANPGTKVTVTNNTFAGAFVEGAISMTMYNTGDAAVVTITGNDFSGVTAGDDLHIYNVEWSELTTDIADADIVTK